MARELIRRGDQVWILTEFPNYPSGKVYPDYPVQLWQKVVIEGAPLAGVALYPGHDRWSMRRAPRMLSQIRGVV